MKLKNKFPLKNVDRSHGKISLLWLIVLLVCSPVWAQTSFLDLADLVLDEIEFNDPNQPQPLPFDSGNDILAVGVAGALSDPDDQDGYSFTLTSAELVDLKFEITAGSDTDIVALDIGPDNQIYFITGGGLWRQPTNSSDPNNVEQLATAQQLAQPLGLTAETLNVSDMALLPDPNQTLILITLADRGDILAVDSQGSVTLAISEAQITAVTGQLTADLTSIAVGIDLVSPSPPDSNENPIVLMQTNMGDIEIELFPEDAPITVQNFVDYINSGFYEGIIFHRVVKDFVIQGGGFDPNLIKKNPNPPIISEATLSGRRNLRGTVSMALSGTDENSGTSQFFVNLVDNNFLDFDVSTPPFTVFGEVTPAGMVVVDAIAQVTVADNGGFQNVPVVPVIIETVTVTNEDALPDPPQMTFPVYVADQNSGHVLELSLDSSDVSIFTHTDDLTDTLRSELSTNDLISGTTDMPQTVVAEKEGRFITNALVRMPTGQLYPEGFFVSQLSDAFAGDGSVTHILPDSDNPTEAVFTALFDPNDFPSDDPNDSLLDLNPSALAWDSDGAFGGKLFLGTFGPSLGDEFDGQVFVVEPNGLLQPFVTEFVDLSGNPVMMDANQVDGFFDVTDMAFSPGGAFGQYLYVISENIDNNGPDTDGGFQSDLWRIDPAGRAELFVPDIADAAVTLAFGGFEYGGDLYVATFSADQQQSGEIFRIDSSGSVQTFFSLDPFGSGLSISDITFSPVSSLFQGNLLLTLKSGNQAFLVEIPLDQDSSLPPTWATSLQTGDVSSGDLVFDETGNLFVLEQAAKRLTRLDYQNLLDYTLLDLQIRPDGAIQNDPNYVPYVLLTAADQPRILNLSDGQADNLATEVSPQFLDIAGVDENDQGNSVAFTFDDQGDLFLFVQNSGDVQTSSRDDAQKSFSQLTTSLTKSALETESGLSDIELTHLAWAADGTLIAKAINGPDAPALSEADGLLGNALLSLGNTTTQIFSAQTLLNVNELTTMQLTLTGPVTNETFKVIAGSPFEQTFDPLESGDFTIAIRSLSQTFGDYDLLAALATQTSVTLIATQASGPQVITTRDGERLELTLTGSGQATLAYEQRPGSGVVITLQTLTLQETRPDTLVQLRNLDNPGNIILEQILLDGSLEQLELIGQIDTISTVAGSKGTIQRVDLGDLLAFDAPDYHIKVLAADNLGDPNRALGEFDLRSVDQLLVGGDINNISFLKSASRNTYQEMIVGGAMIDSTFFGRNIITLDVDNNLNGQPRPNALDNVTFNFSVKGSQLRWARIARGSVVNSTFIFRKQIDRLELLDGNLDTTTLMAGEQGGQINTILVGRLDNQPTNDAGNIIDTQITAFRQIRWVHADGQISGTTNIRTMAQFPFRTTINQISSGGDLNANITAFYVNVIHAGVDRNDRRLPEDDNFSGADFTGTVAATLRIKEVSATGAIRNATLQSRFGNIINLFAEDGFIDSTVQVANRIARVMVGYIDGNRKNIINEQADVSGTITARKLGRLYYTGAQTANLDGVRRLGPIVDDVDN